MPSNRLENVGDKGHAARAWVLPISEGIEKVKASKEGER